MSEQLPENFGTEEELVEWFESADLSLYRLQAASDVVVANEVKLTLAAAFGESMATAGAAAVSRLELVES